VKSPVDENIYCFPSHGNRVLKIDTERNEAYEIGPVIEGRYKFLGGCVDADGNVIGVPSDYHSVLKVDVRTGGVKTFGEGCLPPSLRNKWQGAVLAKNGKIYCLPANAQGVLIIDSRAESLNIIGSLPETFKKYQGGFLSDHDNCIYAIPECASKILCIDVDKEELRQLDSTL
jgi:hypothetical protein